MRESAERSAAEVRAPEAIYLDANATVRPLDCVVEAVTRAMREAWGNPSSAHANGIAARGVLVRARDAAAALLSGIDPDDVVLTSGGTEASNTILAAAGPGSTLIVSAVEHPATLRPAERARSRGADLVVVPVDGQGQSDPGAFAQAVVRAATRSVYASVQWANGETGVVQPVAAISAAIHSVRPDAIIHVDAAQAVGRIRTQVPRERTDLLTGYGVEILRITPLAGRIAVALKRPRRGILHLSEVWARRKLEPSAPKKNMALVVGEQEDDGALFYISLESDFDGREQAAPHTLVSGTTGSGKGILVSNLILDVCAFNDPRSVQIYLIDPKRGADYLWARDLPHLREGIVEDRDAAIALLRRLVAEMEQRYRQITQAGCANIAQYNRSRAVEAQLPRVVIFFDEVANWMQDEDFKKEVEGVINEIATKSRAAGLHLFMIYQRADKDVMSMQLRTNLGNKLILRLARKIHGGCDFRYRHKSLRVVQV